MSFAAVAVAASVVSAGFQLKAASDQSRSLKNQAATAQMEARVAELGVTQTAARRMEALVADLGAIQAKRATQNVTLGGSAAVATNAYEKEYLSSLRSDILNQRYGIVAKNQEAASLRAGAKATMLSGYANAFSSIAGGFQSYSRTKPK